ncbi:MAG: hypothetical protein K9M11_01505 [Candidatus Pacebacteria bacterium]|nr:hypothetical protein [Candidatus Paceibacterota bacterium]
MKESGPMSSSDNTEPEMDSLPAEVESAESAESVDSIELGDVAAPESADKRSEMGRATLISGEIVNSMKAELVEQAEELVGSMMSEINKVKGRARLELIRESLDFLTAERNRAELSMRGSSGKVHSASIFLTYEEAIKKLESMLELQSPKEKVEAVIESKLKKAYEKIETGALIDAIPLLYTALTNPQFKRFWARNTPEIAIKRAEIETLLASTRERWEAAGKPIK